MTNPQWEFKKQLLKLKTLTESKMWKEMEELTADDLMKYPTIYGSFSIDLLMFYIDMATLAIKQGKFTSKDKINSVLYESVKEILPKLKQKDSRAQESQNYDQIQGREAFSFFDSMDCVYPTKSVKKQQENIIKSKESTAAAVSKEVCQNPVFTAFSFSLNIDPKLLEIITEGDEQVGSLSGRSGSGNNSPTGSGRSSPSPITQKKDIS